MCVCNVVAQRCPDSGVDCLPVLQRDTQMQNDLAYHSSYIPVPKPGNVHVHDHYDHTLYKAPDRIAEVVVHVSATGLRTVAVPPAVVDTLVVDTVVVWTGVDTTRGRGCWILLPPLWLRWCACCCVWRCCWHVPPYLTVVVARHIASRCSHLTVSCLCAE